MNITKHRPKKNREWKRLVAEWQVSGLNAKAFCRQHSLVYTTFIQKRNQLLAASSQEATVAPFLEIIDSQPKTTEIQKESILLSCGPLQINLPYQSDLNKLVECLKVLKEVAICSR